MRLPVLLLLLLPGCSAVHNAQMQNVKAFAKSSQTLSSAPAELYHDISDFRQELRLVESSTLFTAEKIIPRLNQSLAMQKAFEDNVSKVRDACELISTYSEGLVALVGTEKDLEDKT